MKAKSFWKWLLPDRLEIIERGRAGLIIITCLALAGAVLLLILTWLISGDLQIETIVAGLFLCAILAGIVRLGQVGRVRLGSWSLIVLLEILIALDVMSYGVGEPAAAAFFIPILLATCSVSLWAGLGIALASSLVVWGTAWAVYAGWYEPQTPFQLSHVTFNAPMYMVIFFVAAVLVGWWSDYLVRWRANG